ncbi:hypothetical protein [Catellatospora sp. NPDC049133]|uniref:hypothetical protein n=1 Tax=Catellatospora sp. NPDC049133 TaxID=3155499 RepID=UPI0033FD97F9
MGWKYHSPPGWPTPPEDWTPPAGWRPDPAWPPAPEDWQFWVSDGADDPTLMFELPDDDSFTSLDELIGADPPADEQPVAGVPLSDPVPEAAPAWSAADEVAGAAATGPEPSLQAEPALLTAMDGAELSAPVTAMDAAAQADLVTAMDAAAPTAAVDAAQPAASGQPDLFPAAQPVLAAQTAMAMDAAAQAAWSDERPQPAWPVDPVLSAEPDWITEPAPEPALADAAPPAWTDEQTTPAWETEPAASAAPVWADPANGEDAPEAGDRIAEPVSAMAAQIPPSSEPDTAPADPEPELVAANAVAGPEPLDPADTPGFEPIVAVTGPVAPVYGPVTAPPLTSGIAWPSPVDPPSAEPAPDTPVAVPVAGVPIADVPAAGVPVAGGAVPAMAFAAASPDPAAGGTQGPDGAHVPAHAATHVPAHAAPARRKPWWVWGLAGAAGLLLCTVVGVGGFVATRIGGSSGAVADPSATEVGSPPDARSTQQAQGRPIPTPSRQAAEALPQDQVFEGTGPQVVPVELGSTFHTVALTYSGTGPFVVRTVKADGQEIQTLVSAAESYEGVRPLDLGEMRPDAVSIQAEGGWRMVVRPLASAQTFSGNASGVGADVLLIPRTAAESVKVAFDHRGTGKFTVQAIGADSATLISQEGDFTGETMLPRGTVVVVIDTNGVWTFSRE